MLLLAPLAGVAAGRMRVIRQTSASATAMNADLKDRLRDPFLKVSLGIRIAVILGIVLLMGAKPELWASVGIVGTAIVLGFLSTAQPSRKTASLSVST
jgi:hypothetical protein